MVTGGESCLQNALTHTTAPSCLERKKLNPKTTFLNFGALITQVQTAGNNNLHMVYIYGQNTNNIWPDTGHSDWSGKITRLPGVGCALAPLQLSTT